MLKIPVWLIAILVLGFGNAVQAAETFTYTVKRNDALTSIAKKECGNYSAYLRLARINGLANPNMIHPGQVLTISCEEMSNVRASVEVSVLVQAVQDDVVKKAMDSIQLVGASSVQTDKVEPGFDYSVRYSSPARDLSEADIEDYIYQMFGSQGPIALSVFRHESGLNPNAKGWNCRYWSSSKRRWVSQACRPQDRSRAWSVDCGVAQINVRGQNCPAHLMTVEGNLSAAVAKYEEGGWNRWVSYQTRAYRKYLARYRNFEARDGVILLGADLDGPQPQ
jgi:LysM repeat protein